MLELGNLDAKRDWGFAREYVEGMWRMLQANEPDTYVLATQRTETVRDFVNGAAAALRLRARMVRQGRVGSGQSTRRRGRTVVAIDASLLSSGRGRISCVGDPSKAKAKLGWEAKTSLEELIEMMARADHDRVKTGYSMRF